MDAAVVIKLMKTWQKERVKRRRRKKRSFWCRSWLCDRPVHGAYHALLCELRECDRESFQNFLRMDVSSFQLLLSKVTPTIERQDTIMRKSIPAPERLALTLRWLASGMYTLIAICCLIFGTKFPSHPSTFRERGFLSIRPTKPFPALSRLKVHV